MSSIIFNKVLDYTELKERISLILALGINIKVVLVVKQRIIENQRDKQKDKKW